MSRAYGSRWSVIARASGARSRGSFFFQAVDGIRALYVTGVQTCDLPIFNSAGYGSSGAVEDVPIDEARRQFEVNVFGLARLTQLVTPAMRAQGSGRIVNISSIGGKLDRKSVV